MDNKVYKLIELTGTSTVGIEDAVQNAITKASKSIRRMSWFKVTETRGRIDEDGVTQWQVTIKAGFAVEE